MSSSYPPTQSILVFNRNNFSNSAPPIRTIEKTEQVEVEVPKPTRFTYSQDITRGNQADVTDLIRTLQYKEGFTGVNGLCYISFGSGQVIAGLTYEANDNNLKYRVVDLTFIRSKEKLGYLEITSNGTYGKQITAIVPSNAESESVTLFLEFDAFEFHRQ